MSIYRQRVVLKRHKSNIAFLEAKMLLLYIFLLSCCLSGSMGSATEEFQVKLKALVDLASKEIFLPVPVRKFQCSHVPCHLKRTIERVKVYSTNDQMRMHISLMEKIMNRIISALNKAHTKPEKDGSCPMAEMSPQNALKHYERFFQKLHEKC